MTEQNLNSILNELSELRSRVAQLEAEAAAEMDGSQMAGAQAPPWSRGFYLTYYATAGFFLGMIAALVSLAFTVVFWGLLVLAGIGTAVIQIVPLIGFLVGLMMACVVPLAWFAQAILLLYYGFQAYKGRRFAIPGLSSFLRDQNWL